MMSTGEFNANAQAIQDKVNAWTDFENCCTNMMNTMENEKMKKVLTWEDKVMIQEATKTGLRWLGENQEAQAQEIIMK